MITVVCWKWSDPDYRFGGDRYTDHHVNALAASFRRHLTLPHRFVCVFDDFDVGDIDSDLVECRWSFQDELKHSVGSLKQLGGTWRRVRMFDPVFQAGGLRITSGDKIVLTDLDAVVCGNLDAMIGEDVPFAAMQALENRPEYNTGFMMYRAFEHADIWRRFSPEVTQRTRYKDWWEQEWINTVVGPGQRLWTSKDGVFAYGRHCSSNGGALPDGARYVSFFGPHDPGLPECQAKSPWILDHWRAAA